jgi:transposase-like protein
MAKRVKAIYDPLIHPELARRMASDGYSCDQISKQIGICKHTLYTWFELYPALRDGWADGRNNRLIEYESALESICKKRTLTTTETFEKDGVKYVKTIVKECDPSSHALMNYLRCKCPEKYMKPSMNALGDLLGLKNAEVVIPNEDQGL